MQCFKDRNGKQWTLDLNIGTARRVKAECGIDLVNVVTFTEDGANTSVFQRLADDPYTLVSVIYSLCRQQAADANMTDEAFASLFDAETIESAIEALVQEVINFSQPAKKKMLMLIFNKTRELKEKAEKRLDNMMQSKEFNEALDAQLNNLLTNTQES